MPPRRCLLLIALALAGLGAPGVALAQQEVPAAEPAAPEPASPPPVVPIPEVASRGEELRRALRSASARLAPDPVVAVIERQLPELRDELETARREARERIESDPSLDGLADLEREWAGRTRSLERWRAALTKRAAAIEAELALLEEARGLWRRTLEEGRASDAPADLVAAIRLNVEEIAAVRKRATTRRSELLSLLNEVAREEIAASDVLADLADARASQRARLFHPDGSTLWQALAAGSAIATIPKRVRATVGADAREVLRFAADRRRDFAPLGLVFAAALAGASFARARLRRRGREGAAEGSVQIFDRPVSIAFLTAFLTALLVFPYAPAIAAHVVGALLLVPVIRIVRPVVHPAFRPLLYGLAGFYLVDRVRDVVDAVVLLERLLFVTQALVGAGLLLWLLSPARLATLPRGETPPAALGGAMRAALALLLVATLANVLGYTAFSRVLGQGVFTSAYLAVLFYAAHRVGLTVLLVLLSSPRAGGLGVVAKHGDALLRGARLGLALAAGLLWLASALGAFAVREPVEALLRSVLTTPLTLGTISISLGDVAGFALTVWAAVMLSRGLSAVLDDDVLPRMDLGRGVPAAISTSVRYAILLGGLLLALGAAGIDFSRFTLLAGALGVGIGFGLQNVVNNFVSGLILLYERPVQLGDIVEVGDLMGRVARIGIRSSTVRTFDGSEVIVPNANLISEQLVNWTLSDPKRRIEIDVGVAYGSDHEKVLRVLLDAARGAKYVLADPEPYVLFKGFGESSLDFEVRIWTTAETFLDSRNSVTSAIYAALARAKIEIPFPQRDLHLRSVSARARGPEPRSAESGAGEPPLEDTDAESDGRPDPLPG